MKTKFLACLLITWAAIAPLTAAELTYLSGDKPDPVELLAPPPLAASPEQNADLAEVRAVFSSAPAAERALAKTERTFDAFIFSRALGDSFHAGKYPVTEEFLRHVQDDADAAVGWAKKYYRRPRPYTVDPTLANGKLETSYSYPSGHSTESMTLALVLTELFPAKRDAILAEARQIGWHRVIIARHYPTDIYAGRVYAQAIVREMKTNAKFRKDLAAAQAELAALSNTH